MRQLFTSDQRYQTRDYFVLGVLFLAVLIYCLSNPPLTFPDTNTYLKAHIYRFPGYIYFLRGVRFLFGSGFEMAVVVIQLLMGLVAVFIGHRLLSKLFSLSFLLRIALAVLLVFPFFEPFMVANKLVSEGLAYPLYLLMICHALKLLFDDRLRSLWVISGCFILLVLTRGQFVIVAPILLVIFLLKYRFQFKERNRLLVVICLFSLPILTNLLDRTHRELVYGYFETTPFSFVNAITLPLYVSDKEDSMLFEDSKQQDIFQLTYYRMDQMDLLASEVDGDTKSKYLRFHENFPQICNQNFHEQGRNYLEHFSKKPYYSSIQIEKESEEMFLALLSDNRSLWLDLYLAGIRYGFKADLLLLFVVLVFIIFLLKSLRRYQFEASVLFLGTSLLLSNAMVTALASHSIQRYLFYNYFLGFIVVILVGRKLMQLYETRSLGGDALPK